MRAVAAAARLRALAQRLKDKQHALFLGRGALYAVAMECTLKLKEITYIHAEATADGERQHGPLARVATQEPLLSQVTAAAFLG